MRKSRFELYVDRLGDWRWRLKAANGRIIADSGEGYERASAALKAVKRIKAAAAAALVPRRQR